MYILTYWSGPWSQGSEAWSFPLVDYNKNWGFISPPRPGGAQWLSVLFSLSGRWKWRLVFGHASLRENLQWDINKVLESEGNHSGAISYGQKLVIFHRAVRSGCSFHSCLLEFMPNPKSNKNVVLSEALELMCNWLRLNESWGASRKGKDKMY